MWKAKQVKGRRPFDQFQNINTAICLTLTNERSELVKVYIRFFLIFLSFDPSFLSFLFFFALPALLHQQIDPLSICQVVSLSGPGLIDADFLHVVL